MDQAEVVSGACGRDVALGNSDWRLVALLRDAGMFRCSTFLAAFCKTARLHAGLEATRPALALALLQHHLAGWGALLQGLYSEDAAGFAAACAAAEAATCRQLFQHALAASRPPPEADPGSSPADPMDTDQQHDAAAAQRWLRCMDQRAACEEALHLQLIQAAAALAPTNPQAAHAWLLGSCRQLLGLPDGAPATSPAGAAPDQIRGWRWWGRALPTVAAELGCQQLLQLLGEALPATAGDVRSRHAAAGLLTALLQQPSTAAACVAMLADALRAAADRDNAHGAAAVLLLAQLALDAPSYRQLLDCCLFADPEARSAAAAGCASRPMGFIGAVMRVADAACPLPLLQVHKQSLQHLQNQLARAPGTAGRETARSALGALLSEVHTAIKTHESATEGALPADMAPDPEAVKALDGWLLAYERGGGGRRLPKVVEDDLAHRKGQLTFRQRDWYMRLVVNGVLLVPPGDRRQAQRHLELAQALRAAGHISQQHVDAFCDKCRLLGVDPEAPPAPVLQPSALAAACRAPRLEQLLHQLAGADPGAAGGAGVGLLLGRVERELGRLVSEAEAEAERQLRQPLQQRVGNVQGQQQAAAAAQVKQQGPQQQHQQQGQQGGMAFERQAQLLVELLLHSFLTSQAAAAAAATATAPAARPSGHAAAAARADSAADWCMAFVAMLHRQPRLHTQLLQRIAALALGQAGALGLAQAAGLGALLACMGSCAELAEPCLDHPGASSGDGSAASCRPSFAWACSLEAAAAQAAGSCPAAAAPAAAPAWPEGQQGRHPQTSRGSLPGAVSLPAAGGAGPQQAPGVGHRGGPGSASEQGLPGWEFVELLLQHAALGSAEQLRGTCCMWVAYLRRGAGAAGWCAGRLQPGLESLACTSHQRWQPGNEVVYLPTRLIGLLEWLQRRLPTLGADAAGGGGGGGGTHPPGDGGSGLPAQLAGCRQLCQQMLESPMVKALAEASGQAGCGSGGGSCSSSGGSGTTPTQAGSQPCSQRAAAGPDVQQWEAAALRQGLPLPQGMAAEVAALVARRLARR